MTETAPGREALVIRVFVELADTLVDDYDVIDLLDRLAGSSIELLAADAVGILLGDAESTLRVVATTNEQVEWMELLQLQAEEGPCLDCYRSGVPVSVTDLADAALRWPQFIAALTQRGTYGSVHALPLRLRGQAIGTLNLFHHQPGPLPEADLALGQALADVATVGILSERAIRRGEVVTEQLQRRAEQPDRHRTGQGRAGPARWAGHGRRLRPATPLRPPPQPAPERGRQPGRADRPRRRRAGRRAHRTRPHEPGPRWPRVRH